MSGNPRVRPNPPRARTDMHSWDRARTAPMAEVFPSVGELTRKAAEGRSMNEFRTGQGKDVGMNAGRGGLGSGKDTTSPTPLSKDLLSAIEARLDRRRFQDHHWTGTFWEYLDLCAQNPSILRNAYQRLYDAILSHGSEKYKVFKKDCTRYNFFSDPFDNGQDAIYGLDFALMALVDFFRSAAEGYGTDKRILLL